MTYKWEAMVEDLTVERDKLLKEFQFISLERDMLDKRNFRLTKEVERLRNMLEAVTNEISMVAGAYGLEGVVSAARAALKETS